METPNHSIKDTDYVKLIVRGFDKGSRVSVIYKHAKTAKRAALKAYNTACFKGLINDTVKSVCIVTASGHVLFYQSAESTAWVNEL